MRKTLAFGLVAIGVLTGAVAMHAFQLTQQARFANSGLFTVGPREGVRFHVALDDAAQGAPLRVILRLLDQGGAVVADDRAMLRPGHSKSLEFREPGLYRAQAEVLDSSGQLSARRVVVSTVELFDVDDLIIKRFVCGAGDVISHGGVR